MVFRLPFIARHAQRLQKAEKLVDFLDSVGKGELAAVERPPVLAVSFGFIARHPGGLGGQCQKNRRKGKGIAGKNDRQIKLFLAERAEESEPMEGIRP